MIHIKRCAALAVLGAGLTACTSGQSAVEPSFTPVNLASTTTLQFAVGTANLNGGASTGLNTVVTFRQQNGLDATLLNSPTITGPAGFVNNGGAAVGVDNGTSNISSSAFPQLGTPATPSTFGTSGGAFSYGFAPDNSTTGGGANFTQYSQPFFAKQQLLTGGPPLFPFVRDGTFPSAFRGYPVGFTAFDNMTLATGQYVLTVTVPSANVAPFTANATGTLSSLALLPAIAAPAGVVHAGVNGISFTATIPAGLTETIAYVEDTTTVSFYSIRTTASGAVTFTVPDNLGPHAFGQPATPSFNAGDKISITVVGYDYPAFEAGPPGNTSPNPTIVGANRQADITMSPKTTATF